MIRINDSIIINKVPCRITMWHVNIQSIISYGDKLKRNNGGCTMIVIKIMCMLMSPTALTKT